MGQAMAKRVKATILFATETGKSQDYAKTLCEIFKHAFDAKVTLPPGHMTTRLCVERKNAPNLFKTEHLYLFSSKTSQTFHSYIHTTVAVAVAAAPSLLRACRLHSAGSVFTPRRAERRAWTARMCLLSQSLFLSCRDSPRDMREFTQPSGALQFKIRSQNTPSCVRLQRK